MALVPIGSKEGVVWVQEINLSGDDAAARRDHQEAIEAFVEQRDARGLARFKGKAIHGVPVVTDTKTIRRLGKEGRLNFEYPPPRLVPIAGPEGLVLVDEDELTEDELSMIGRHHSAIGAFLSEKDPRGLGLAPFKGDVVHGVPLVTDRLTISDLDDDDLLTFESFYEVT